MNPSSNINVYMLPYLLFDKNKYTTPTSILLTHTTVTTTMLKSKPQPTN